MFSDGFGHGEQLTMRRAAEAAGISLRSTYWLHTFHFDMCYLALRTLLVPGRFVHDGLASSLYPHTPIHGPLAFPLFPPFPFHLEANEPHGLVAMCTLAT